jgi:hypothetical protein
MRQHPAPAHHALGNKEGITPCVTARRASLHMRRDLTFTREHDGPRPKDQNFSKDLETKGRTRTNQRSHKSAKQKQGRKRRLLGVYRLPLHAALEDRVTRTNLDDRMNGGGVEGPPPLSSTLLLAPASVRLRRAPPWSALATTNGLCLRSFLDLQQRPPTTSPPVLSGR